MWASRTLIIECGRSFFFKNNKQVIREPERQKFQVCY